MFEVKFKAKEKDGDRWFYGYYFKHDHTTYCFKEDYDSDPKRFKLTETLLEEWKKEILKQSSMDDTDTIIIMNVIKLKNEKKEVSK